MDPYAHEHSVLPCGAETYWQDRRDVEFVKLAIMVWSGNLHNPIGKEGLAHLFEHLPFRGTEHFPTKYDLCLPIEQSGGNVNACTQPTVTEFEVSVPVSDSITGWEVLTDMVFRPLLRPADLVDERAVVETEIANRKARSSIEDRNRVWTIINGQDLGPRMNGLGSRESIATITIGDMQEFHARWYQPSNLTIIAVGNLVGFPGGWRQFLEQQFQNFPAQPRQTRRRFTPLVGTLPTRWESLKLPTKSPTLGISGPLHQSGNHQATAVATRYQAATGILSQILWERGFTSAFPQELRERRNLTYSFGGNFSYPDIDLGWWSLGGVLKNVGDLHQVVQIVTDLLTNPTTFNERQVELARKSLLGEEAFKTFTPGNTFNWMRTALRDEGYIPLRTEWLERIRTLTPDDVQRVVAELLHPSRWVTVVYLPS